MKKVFVTRKLLKENEEKLKELFDVKLNPDDKIYTAAEIIERQADILKPGDCVLVKASLGIGLGAVVKAILQLGQSQGMPVERDI